MNQNKKSSSTHKLWLSGWLSPEGDFISASYGEYDKAARKLEKNNVVQPILDNIISYKLIHGERLLELLGYIKFTYRQINKSYCESTVLFPQQIGVSKDLTQEQIDWLISNYHNMNECQFKYVRLYLKYYYNFN